MKVLDEKAKKMLLLFGIVIGFIVLIIFLVFIIGLFKNKSLEYREIEDKMVEAARKYYTVKEDALPLNEDEEVEISTTLLAEEGYMKELVKYQKDESVSCSGKVIVTKSADYYNYSPYLECGDKYATTYLYEKLLETVVSKDDGLYKTTEYAKEKNNETAYVYKGDYVNNYIKIGEQLFRIVKLDHEYNYMLIEQDYNKNFNYRGPWDDRYNSQKNSDVGINDYYKSKIRKGLQAYYNLLDSNLKSKMIAKNICIGPRSEKDTKKDGSIECKKTLAGEYISLLTTYDYMNASLDANCNSILSKSCSNYNYLVDYNSSFWLLNVSDINTYTGYKVQDYAYTSKLSGTGVARTVVNVTKNLIYTGGSGIYSDPYLVK